MERVRQPAHIGRDGVSAAFYALEEEGGGVGLGSVSNTRDLVVMCGER